MPEGHRAPNAAEHRADDRRRPRAERQADADLARPPHHGVGRDAVEPDRRERQAQRGEEPREHGEQPLAQQRVADERRLAGDVDQAQRRVHVRQRLRARDPPASADRATTAPAACPPASAIGEKRKGPTWPRTDPSRASATTPTISIGTVWPRAACQPASHRPPAGEVLARERGVDDDRQRPRRVGVVRLELAPASSGAPIVLKNCGEMASRDVPARRRQAGRRVAPRPAAEQRPARRLAASTPGSVRTRSTSRRLDGARLRRARGGRATRSTAASRDRARSRDRSRSSRSNDRSSSTATNRSIRLKAICAATTGRACRREPSIADRPRHRRRSAVPPRRAAPARGRTPIVVTQPSAATNARTRQSSVASR